jgi:tetratricopeptide (TPR) repeat protein
MDDLIKQGADAFRAGNKDEARKLLLAAVKQNPESERAWGWLYNVANNDQERIQCLKQMVRINPKNEKANQLLNELTGADFPLERPSLSSTNLKTQSTPEQNPSSVPIAQTSKTATAQKTPDPSQRKNLLIGIGAILFVCFICLCLT